MIKNLTTSSALILGSILAAPLSTLAQKDSLTPYAEASEVPQTALAQTKDQPNIVLIMADDLGYECIGAK